MKTSRRRLLYHALLGGLAVACTPRKSRDTAGSADTRDTDMGAGDSGGGGETAPCDPGPPASDWTPLPLKAYPTLAPEGGSASVIIGGVAVVVAQVSAGCFVALAQTCTHQGCAIEYRSDGGRFVCPCHGALFGYDGAVLGGPAPVPVAAYPATLLEDAVWVRVP